MWNFSGVLSSLAMKRRSEPSGLVSLIYAKLPRLRRTSTGASATVSLMAAPVGERSKVISLRKAQASIHQAIASGLAKRPVEANRERNRPRNRVMSRLAYSYIYVGTVG